MKTIDDIKRLYQGNNMPIDCIDLAIEKGMACKAVYLDRLGLTKENNYRVVLPLPQKIEDLHYAHMLLLEMQKWEYFKIIDFQYLMVGKNKIKTTKMITKLWDKIIRTDDFNCVCDDIHTMRRKNSKDYLEVNLRLLQNFLIAWGDYTKNGMVAVVSANPWDYLVLSGGDDEREYCSYTSCVHPYHSGGRYFNTALCYLNSPSVFVGYTANLNNLDKKIGRTMLYIGGFTTVCSCRAYGTIPEGAVIALRDYCQMRLSIYNQVVIEGIGGNYSWTVKEGAVNCAVVDNCAGAYIDLSYGVVTVEKGKELEKCLIHDGICLQCGDILGGTEQYGICHDCGGNVNKCYSCGNRIDEGDARYYNDYAYCDNCFDDEFSYCEDCDEYYPNDDMYSVLRGDKYVCYSCRNGNYIECDECAEWFEGKDMFGIGDCKYVCTCCIENYTECPDCNQYFKTDNMEKINEDYVCGDCAKKYGKCKLCGDMFDNTYLSEGVCQECWKEREEKVCCG